MTSRTTPSELSTIVPLKIGIDFGGVLSIINKNIGDEDEHQSTEINIPHSLENLFELKKAGHQLYIISYCGEKRANETYRSILKAIPDEDFFNGIYFVKQKSFKVDVCRAIGCDVMIEDKLKTLNHIHSVIPTMSLIWLSTLQMTHSSAIIIAHSWIDIMKNINETVIHQSFRHKANSYVSLDDKLHYIDYKAKW